jgi:hypothetical protein
VSIFDPVAVARTAPGNIGQDQPDPVTFPAWDPDGRPRMALDNDRELDLNVGSLVATEARKVAGGQTEAKIAYDRRLLAPARVQALV